jgi:hypothetical protein
VDTQQREPLNRSQNAIRAAAQHMHNAALRLADDPAALARAARIVRAGLLRGHLTKADLNGPIVQPPP